MVSLETLVAEKADRDIDHEELMVLGDTKFQSLVNQSIWGRRTAQEDQILALQTVTQWKLECKFTQCKCMQQVN